MYSFEEIYSFKEIVFIRHCVPGHSRNIYSSTFPSHFITIISFVIIISWIKDSYNSVLFDWRKKKWLMLRVSDYNHCPCRFRCHRANNTTWSAALFVWVTISLLKSDMPASKSFISDETVQHTSHREFLVKKYHLLSFWNSLSPLKRPKRLTGFKL